jgi:hypothetical protein
MITFQELEITTSLEREALNQAIVQQLSDGWAVGDVRIGLSKDNWHKDASSFAYSCEAKDDRPTAVLFVAFRSSGAPYVSNICPGHGAPNPLGYELYNLILGDFSQKVLRPLEVNGVLKVLLSAPNYKIEEYLSEQAYRCLSAFARNANKSTGRGHPSDLKWWQDFLIAIHKQQQDPPDGGKLSRWFIEEAGWEGWSDNVSNLEDDYEYGLSLLAQYENSRGV